MTSASCFGYPISIFFIVINEFCERFSYYGMRAVLVLYFKNFIKWDDDLSTAIYHTFVAICYLTPIMGAIIADSWLGKFKTIIYLSVVYAVGQVIMAVSSINDLTDMNRDGEPDSIDVHIALSMIGLLLIALGTGGIKPCVAAFGGDQFEEHQDKQRTRFFSIFYLSINAGSLLSTLITPILRGQECGIHTTQKCYPLAFGVPAALMAVALVVFIVGSGMYKKNSPQGNIMLQVSKCIGFALRNRWKHRSKSFPKREHWLDWAKEKYDDRLIAQIKMVMKVLFLYIPLPMFWALFDQQGSRWTLQATTMNGDFGAFQLQPDHMQSVNPILILVLVPIVDAAIYPLIRKCKLNFTPLKKMTVGMFLAGMAFIAAALLQMEIDKTLPALAGKGEVQLRIINSDTQDATVQLNGAEMPLVVAARQATSDYTAFKISDIKNVTVTFSQNTGSSNSVNAQFIEEARQTLLIYNNPFRYELIEDYKSKPADGNNAVRFINRLNTDVSIIINGAEMPGLNSSAISNYTLLTRGKKDITIIGNRSCTTTETFGFGSATTFVIFEECETEKTAPNLLRVTDIQPNTIHMAWQIPQYFLVTLGEVVFSVTGLEFSYSQAPSNMKAVLQAGWLLTVAVGNIIVLIVAEAAGFKEQWAEYVLFASLLVVVCVIFAIMAYFYTYVDPAEIEAQFDEDEMQKKKKEMDMATYENVPIQEKQSKL
ncbi:solute carrier family 15 member 1 [Protopterus annectens]|uniref:solute carrier family 15 member 1 n=1 Tax=Protopterus annectens TaxID=7888 RepID=UPI001CFAB7BB|nr:solute carrier family 15 member 1 [Protopterus annectens]